MFNVEEDLKAEQRELLGWAHSNFLQDGCQHLEVQLHCFVVQQIHQCAVFSVQEDMQTQKPSSRCEIMRHNCHGRGLLVLGYAAGIKPGQH